MDAQTAKPKIRVGRAEMDFQHQGKVLTAVHPFYGPASSKKLQEFIRKDGLKEPTSAELASFVHEYFHGNEPQAHEVNRIMIERFFRGFTGILYLPKDRVAHFIDHPEFGIDSIVDKDNLLKRLSESRARVSFEHLKNLKKEPVKWNNVAKHPYFIAWAGSEEGAEKLAELASRHPNKEAYIRVPDVLGLSEPTARVAALGSYWGGDRLGVDSYDRGDDVDCLAFGVLK